MPVIFSEEDRERLTLQIHKNAIAMFEQKGIKKTSIEELASPRTSPSRDTTTAA